VTAFTRPTVWLLLACAIAGVTVTAQPSPPSNVVIILADDNVIEWRLTSDSCAR